MKKTFLLLFSLVLIQGIQAQQKPLQLIKDRLNPVDQADVKVGGEIGRRIDVTVYNNLLKINIDNDFLSSFQKREPKNNYIGLGKLIDTAVKMSINTKDEKVIAVKNHLIDVVIKTQEPDGYIGNMTPENRIIKLWDIHEMGYIIYGLTCDYKLFGNQKSLAAAQKAADYILSKWSMLPTDWENQTNVATHVGITGIDRTMLTLYKVTGEKRYYDFCLNQHNLMNWNPDIVIGRKTLIEGHIYGYLASSLAQLELYHLQPDDKLLIPAMKAVNFITAKDGMTVTGGIGQVEIWTDDQDGRGDLGETCATAYQLRVYESLFRLNGNTGYGDLMERAIYNALFGAQSPDGRQIRYFTPFEGPRVYHNTDTYCCPCNYRRIVADLPSMVYYKSNDGIAVNLYAASKAKIKMDGYSVNLSQETDYPNSGHIVLKIDPSQPSTFALKFRIPKWCKGTQISVNGKLEPVKNVPDQFAVVERNWKAGDQVTLDFPMEWRLVKGTKRQAGRVAVMRGPLLFCLNPEQNPVLAKKDGADIGKLIIDLASIEKLPVADQSVRPDGIGCRIKAGSSDWAMGNPGNITLTLTEFADPNGKCTYFKTPDLSLAVEDELIGELE
jgi:DUF1680 family protein